MRIAEARHAVVQRGMPQRAFVGGQVVAEDIGPDAQYLAVDALTIHLAQADVGIGQRFEKRADLHAAFEPAAMTPRFGLDQIDPEIAAAAGQRINHIRWDQMRVYVDDGHGQASPRASFPRRAAPCAAGRA